MKRNNSKFSKPIQTFQTIWCDATVLILSLQVMKLVQKNTIIDGTFQKLKEKEVRKDKGKSVCCLFAYVLKARKYRI